MPYDYQALAVDEVLTFDNVYNDISSLKNTQTPVTLLNTSTGNFSSFGPIEEREKKGKEAYYQACESLAARLHVFRTSPGGHYRLSNQLEPYIYEVQQAHNYQSLILEMTKSRARVELRDGGHTYVLVQQEGLKILQFLIQGSRSGCQAAHAFICNNVRIA